MERPVYISADDCERLLTPLRATEIAERALRWEAAGKVLYPAPRALRMKLPDYGFRYHSKAVALPEIGVAGARIVGYSVAADGSRPRADETTRLIVLMDLATGIPRAIVDEHYNYSLRTAASVAVAARAVRPGPVRLGVIGAGVVARASVRVMLAVLDVTAMTVHSRTVSRCQGLVDLAAAALLDLEVTVAESAEQVLARSDVVVIATTSSSPIQAGALRGGLVLCALGSNEIDAAGYLSADHFIVDDWEQTRTASDIAAMIAAGHPLAERLSTTVPELVAQPSGTWSTEESVIIRTEGLASQDIALAYHVWQACTE